MKTLLNLVSLITLSLLIVAFLHGTTVQVILIALWWTIGVHAAVSHRKWQIRRNEAHCCSKTWIFYAWYSLGGVILLFSTKMYEVNAEMMWRYTRHNH